MTINLAGFSAVLLDLDGTIYHEDHPLPGAIELIRLLQARNQPFACLTNSTMSARFVVDRLSRMGLSLTESQVYTAAGAACDFIRARFSANGLRASIFNLATDAPHELLGNSVEWVNQIGQACDAIVVGAPANRFANVERQRIALSLAREGAEIVGMCADRVYPSTRGIEFGSGALSTMLAYAAGQTPTFCGKPEPHFFSELCRRLGVEPEACVIIGDNLESDIAGGKHMGMHTILTLGGVARQSDVDQLPIERRPDAVVSTLGELL